jgi:excisionase family DNA binding protein
METSDTNLQTFAITVKDAAVMLGVSPRTVWRMIADGQLKVVRMRRCTRLLLAEVTKCLNGGCKVGAL